jgi:predicted enzyme related to lactoylglutathione lyase
MSGEEKEALHSSFLCVLCVKISSTRTRDQEIKSSNGSNKFKRSRKVQKIKEVHGFKKFTSNKKKCFLRRNEAILAKAIGLGGVFVKYQDPENMKNWFEEVLGLQPNDYGVLFAFNHGQSDKGYLQLGTFPAETDYFGSEKQQVMLNFRVDDLESLKGTLESKGVTVCNEIETYEYGKFLHILDPEGNRVELWEPVDRVFDGEKIVLMK